MSKNFNLPAQKIPDSKKTKKWFKENIDAIDSNGFFLEEGVRASYKNRRINYDLYNGKLDMNDLVRTVNPNELKGLNLEQKIQHYPIAVPRLNVLIGEELKRRFDYKIILTNPDSVSIKEEEKLALYMQSVQEFLTNNYKEEELEKKMMDLQDYMDHDWQDHREIVANKILRHLFQELKLKHEFNDGFKDVLLAGEEYYMADIVSGDPVLRRVDTEKVYWLRSGFSNRIEDSDLIVIDEYWSPGRIVDTYHDVLTNGEMDTIQRGITEGGGSSSNNPFRGTQEPDFVLAETNEEANIINGLIESATHGNTLNRSMDNHGNIRVLKVLWRSWRRVKKVKYFDEQGDEQFEYFPDSYKVDETKGESASYIWINEWLEATKIAEDIYVNLRPKPVQYHKLNNPSYCHPGIVGRTYSTSKFTTVSLMDRLKHYQYLYDTFFDRLNKLLSNHRGKVLVMDFSIIPDGWEPEQWFAYLANMNIAVKDSFKEGAKGAATGKLAGNLGRGGDHSYIDLDQSNAIQHYIGLLEFIKQQMSEISGVSDQRLGQIENRETIGGVERSITQSSHITEWYFSQHEDVKLDALALLLDTAKIAYKGKNKKVQYILDDLNIQMLNIDGDDVASHEYGIVATTNSRSQEMERTIMEGAYALMQRGEMQLSTLMDIFNSNSIADKRRKIETKEKQKAENESKQFEQQQAEIAQAREQAMQLEMAKLKLEDTKNIRDNETKLMIAGMNADELADAIAEGKLSLDQDKLTESQRQFDEKMMLDNDQFNRKLEVEKMKAQKSKTSN